MLVTSSPTGLETCGFSQALGRSALTLLSLSSWLSQYIVIWRLSDQDENYYLRTIKYMFNPIFISMQSLPDYPSLYITSLIVFSITHSKAHERTTDPRIKVTWKWMSLLVYF